MSVMSVSVKSDPSGVRELEVPLTSEKPPSTVHVTLTWNFSNGDAIETFARYDLEEAADSEPPWQYVY